MTSTDATSAACVLFLQATQNTCKCRQPIQRACQLHVAVLHGSESKGQAAGSSGEGASITAEHSISHFWDA